MNNSTPPPSQNPKISGDAPTEQLWAKWNRITVNDVRAAQQAASDAIRPYLEAD
jgi:hypothetical protein